MKRILSGLLSLLLLASVLVTPAFAAAPAAPEGYRQAAANARFALYAHEATGNFSLADLATGAVWNSAPLEAAQNEALKGAQKNRLLSFVTGTLLDPELGKETAFYSGVLAGQGKIDYAPIQNGYRVTIHAQKVSFDLEVTLQADHLAIRFVADRLQEETVWLQNIQLAPNLGAGSADDTGFLLVPDGCGALIQFNNGKKGSYDEPVYGVDKAFIRTALAVEKQTVALPVYGIQKGKAGLLAVLSQGAEAASIQAATAGNGSPYNTAGASFTLREKASQSITQEVAQTVYEPRRTVNTDLELLLYPVVEANSGYVGMANTLKGYLQKQLGMQPLQGAGPAGVLTLYGGIAQKARFLGVPLWEQPATLTGFERAGELLAPFAQAGPMALELLEWEQNQILGKAAGSTRPAGALGGKKALAALAEACARQQTPLYAGVAAAAFSKGGNGASVGSSAVRSLTQEPAAQYTYWRASYAANQNSAFYLRAPGQLPGVLGDFSAGARALGFTGLSVTDLGALSYSDYRTAAPVSAPQSARLAAEALAAAGQNGSVAVHGGLLFAAQNAQLVLDAPSSASSFTIADGQVPFYQLALSGLVRYAALPVNQQANPQQALLWALETGSLLNWSFADVGVLEQLPSTRLAGLTGLSWQFGGETALKQAEEYLPLLEQIAGQPIASHQKLAEGVWRTGFAGGQAVAVNYSQTDYAGAGFTVPAMGYYFWQKGAV